MRLPPSLKRNKVIPRPLRILKRLTQLIKRPETKIQVRNHLRITRVRLTRFARFSGHQGRAGDRHEEEHECCAEDDGDDLVVHAPEGVVFFVDVKEAGDGCCGFDAHATRVVVAWSLSGAAGLDVAF